MRVCTGKGTVGTVAVGDIDNDGYADIVVPQFASSVVEVYSFKPAQ